jgi:hypothetical protein
MISKYFLDGFGSDDELNELLASDTLPLVREMQFKYGLKVMGKVANVNYPNQDQIAYMMCYSNGLALGKVWTTRVGGANSDQLEYCFRSPFYVKSRGSDANDRETIRSTKLSSLMATLKRQSVVADAKILINNKVNTTRRGLDTMRRAMGNSTKDNPFTAEEIHVMLATVLGESTDGFATPLNLNKCKNTLDVFKEADRILGVKLEECNRFFRNPFYLIGMDGFKHLLIGKFKMTVMNTEDSFACQYETIEDFKRVKTIEEYPALLPLLTMMKVSYETKPQRKIGELNFPIWDGYDAGLDAVFFSTSGVTHYEHTWMATPCAT